MTLDVHQHPAAEPDPGPRVVFAYDFGSPESYVALERLAKSMAALAPELTPVRAAALDPLPAPDDAARRAAVETLATESGLLPLVWPAGFPALDTTDAVTVASYAKSIGKVAVFSLSLFRQIYAGGNDPADRSTLYLAAVASEIHPRAVDQALSRESVRAKADAATEAARADGITSVPALRIGERLLTGPAVLELAATALADVPGDAPT